MESLQTLAALAVSCTSMSMARICVGPKSEFVAASPPEREGETEAQTAAIFAFSFRQPIVTPLGEPLGDITVFDVVSRDLSSRQLRSLEALSRHIADLCGHLGGAVSLSRRAVPTPSPDPPSPGNLFLDRSDEAAIFLDSQCNVSRTNRAAAQALGRTPRELLGQNLWDLMPEAIGQPLYWACKAALNGGEPVVVEDAFPVVGRRNVIRIFRDLEGLSLLFAVDPEEPVSERLRALGHCIREAQEDERRRISRELHDVIGQDLTVIKLSAERLRRKLSMTEASSELIELCADIVRDTESALHSSRRIATELRPSLLDQLGLNAALESHVNELSRRTGLACTLNIPISDRKPSPGRDTAVFRVVQELLTNVVRHADARIVEINLFDVDGALRIEVRDDGQGFPEVPSDGRDRVESLGLLGVRERVADVGGTLEIRSIKGVGTSVNVLIPTPDAPEISEQSHANPHL